MADERTPETSALFDAMGDGVYVLDTDGSILEVNDYFVDLTGYSRDTLLGAHPRMLIDDADVERFEAAIRSLLAEGETGHATVEAELRRADGNRVPAEANLTLVTGTDGVEGTMGVVRDVTERHERERELERYRRIVEAAGDSIYTLDLEGNYTSVNDRFVEWVGYDREEVIGKHVSNYLRQDDIERIRDAIVETVRAGESFVGEFDFQVQFATGEWREVQGRLSVLRYGGEVRGTVGVVRDITEQREHERQLTRQNERLDRFASALSHDLRSPLNVAQGRLNLAADECDSAHLEAARESISRMEGLITGMLSLARQGQPVGETITVDLSSVVDRAWRDTNAPDAELVVEDDLGAVEADPDRLAQLFGNLFANAVTHGGERVTVRVGRLEQGFYVEDSGPGIPESVADRLFEWGVTSDSTGTGFGLAIVETIVDAHGWTVTATEGTDGGARFEVEVDHPQT